MTGLGIPAAAFLAGGGQQDPGPSVTPAIDMFTLQHALSTGEPVLSDHDRDLLGLLAGGVNEAAIAGAFGCSVRTVTRQVRRIMQMTGADNHFQAGVEASRRGWV